MTLQGKHLLGLPVETQSGQPLGKIQNFSLDPSSHTILQYEVRRHGILKDLLPVTTLLIHASQVVSITEEKMVVEDLAARGEREPGVSRAAASPW